MLVGREGELERLARMVLERRPFVLCGEAGIGKTALLSGAVQAAGARAHAGGGLAALAWMAYMPVARAMGAEPPAGDASRVAAWVASRVGDDVLVLDDLQWADPATLGLLGPLAWTRTLVLGAVRRGDPGAAAALESARAAGAEVVEVGELDRDRAAELLARTRPELDRGERARLVEQVGGNPLMLLELSRTVGSPALRLSLEARLGRLSPAGRRAAALIAVLGRPAPPELAGDGTRELFDAGLAVRTGAGEVALRHALLAEGIAETLGAGERRELHLHLAARLADRGEAARHLAAGGRPEAAHSRALEAGAIARRPGERARHLLLAADCSARQWWADELRLRAAESLVLAGEYGEAVRQTRAVEGPEAEVRARVSLWEARARWAQGEHDAARETIRAGLAAVEGSGGVTEARLAIEEAHQLARRSAEPDARFYAALERTRALGVDSAVSRCVIGIARCNAGDPAAPADLRAGLLAARELGDVALECEAGEWLARAWREQVAPAEAEAVCAELEGRCAELGLRGREAEFALGRLSARIAAHGSSPDAIDGLRAALGAATEPGLAGRIRAALGLALADGARTDEAHEILRDGDAPVLRAARAGVAWLAGQPGRALEAGADPALPAVAWARLEAGEPVVVAAEPPGPAPRAARAAREELRAVAALATGDDEAAERRFAGAAALWRGLELRCEVRCAWAAGEAARRAGDLEGARVRLEGAEALAERGAQALMLGRVRRSLRAAGARRRAAPASSRGPLSPREREVLELVGAGLTSPEIALRLGIARSTVETLVRSAMRKLGARSRRQAAAVLAAGAA